MTVLPRLAALAAAIGVLGGCAVTPLDESASRASQNVRERGAPAPAWPLAASAETQVPAEPLELPAALAFAFAHNPGIHVQYARLGIAQADLQEAARIANPTLSLAWLSPEGGGRDQTTRGIAASFSDLLLLPARRRLSQAELRRTERAVESALMALAREVEVAWFDQAAAVQALRQHESAARVAETALALAQRYFEAGNIPQLQLDERRTRAAEARMAAHAAQAAAAAARARLADRLGLRAAASWRTTEQLPAPPEARLADDGLAARALRQRFDLAALDEEVAMAEDLRATAGRWRLLGPVEAGFERERDTGGSVIRGPTLALELPLFDQGQGAIAHADARLLDARARRAALALAVENEVAAGVAGLEAARATAALARDLALPALASEVERRQERVNYMLEGPFALLEAREREYAATARWLGAVRDYWVARAALRATVGGALPGDGDAHPPALPTEAIDAAPEDPHRHHGGAP